MSYHDIDIPFFVSLMREAGRLQLHYFNNHLAIKQKHDQSPVTEADEKTNALLLEKIATLYPHSNFISEEKQVPDYAERQHWQRLWLIDPLDGTREFIHGNPDFTINVALVEDGVPTFGIVFAPASGLLYYGKKEEGSFVIETTYEGRKKNSPTAPFKNLQQVRVITSRSHVHVGTENFIQNLKAQGKKVSRIEMGSSLKICMVADGHADVYPRFGTTMEWDTAAAHAVLLYAGKNLYDLQTNQPLRYNKPDLRNPSFVAA